LLFIIISGTMRLIKKLSSGYHQVVMLSSPALCFIDVKGQYNMLLFLQMTGN
jgi:hypothetical protein